MWRSDCSDCCPLNCAEAKDPETKGGTTGKVVAVDATKGTVTIADANNRERTYSITEETVIVGPRGGVVHSRLKDHRFHSGLPITVVANGSTATELHLGYDRKARGTAATSRRPDQPSASRRAKTPTRPIPDYNALDPTPSSTPAPPATTTPHVAVSWSAASRSARPPKTRLNRKKKRTKTANSPAR